MTTPGANKTPRSVTFRDVRQLIPAEPRRWHAAYEVEGGLLVFSEVIAWGVVREVRHFTATGRQKVERIQDAVAMVTGVGCGLEVADEAVNFRGIFEQVGPHFRECDGRAMYDAAGHKIADGPAESASPLESAQACLASFGEHLDRASRHLQASRVDKLLDRLRALQVEVANAIADTAERN